MEHQCGIPGIRRADGYNLVSCFSECGIPQPFRGDHGIVVEGPHDALQIHPGIQRKACRADKIADKLGSLRNCHGTVEQPVHNAVIPVRKNLGRNKPVAVIEHLGF